MHPPDTSPVRQTHLPSAGRGSRPSNYAAVRSTTKGVRRMISHARPPNSLQTPYSGWGVLFVGYFFRSVDKGPRTADKASPPDVVLVVVTVLLVLVVY